MLQVKRMLGRDSYSELSFSLLLNLGATLVLVGIVKQLEYIEHV